MASDRRVVSQFEIFSGLRSVGIPRQLDPLTRDPQPRLFIERADCSLRLLAGFFRFLAEPICIAIGHFSFA